MEALRLLQPSFHVAVEFGSRQFPLIYWHLLWYIQSLSACRMAQALDYSLRAWDDTLGVRGTVAPSVFSLRRLASACIFINIEEACMYTCKYCEEEGMHVYIQRSRAVSMHLYRGEGPLGVGCLAFS